MMNLLEQMQEMTENLNAEELLASAEVEEALLRKTINENDRNHDFLSVGLYDELKEVFDKATIRRFLDIYEDIAYEETYRVRVIFELPSEIDEDEAEYWECDREKWDDDIYIELLDTPGAELVNSRIVDLYCIGDKELQELEEYLEEANRSLDLGEITTEYGRELDKYEPTKNKDC